jgi:hypothetical protein
MPTKGNDYLRRHSNFNLSEVSARVDQQADKAMIAWIKAMDDKFNKSPFLASCLIALDEDGRLSQEQQRVLDRISDGIIKKAQVEIKQAHFPASESRENAYSIRKMRRGWNK